MTEKGLCECECGRKTSVSAEGVSRRFISGHNGRGYGAKHYSWKGGRGTTNGYAVLLRPEHPRAGSKGYVYEHILIAEQALGKYLPGGAVVHHVNGIKTDNKPSNLVICPDQAYHLLLHQRQRALKACGDPTARKCWICKEHSVDVRQGGHSFYHPSCQTTYYKEQQKKRSAKI